MTIDSINIFLIEYWSMPVFLSNNRKYMFFFIWKHAYDLTSLKKYQTCYTIHFICSVFRLFFITIVHYRGSIYLCMVLYSGCFFFWTYRYIDTSRS